MNRSVYQSYLDIDRRHFWRINKRRLVLDLIDRQAPKRDHLRFLDVGSAASLLGLSLQERGEVLLIEPDGPTAELARAEHGLSVGEGSLPDAMPSSADGPFDVVTALDVIEHIDDDVAAVSALVKRMQPDGLMVVTVPALPSLWSEHDEVLHHKRRYVTKDLRAALEAGGLQVEWMSYYTSLLLPVLATQRLLGRMKKREGPKEYLVKVPNPLLNISMGLVQSLERTLLRLFPMPIGAAIVAWGRPKS